MAVRRYSLGSIAAKLTALAAAGAPVIAPPPQGVVARLIALSEQSNAALMKGDAATYARLLSISNDFTLMSPFGGKPSRGSEYTPERIQRMADFFRNGSFRMEVVESYASEDMVVLALIEHSNVQVGGLPAQDWGLRVTLVYRRSGSGWELVHRHADPLVASVDLPQAAALARGERDGRIARTPCSPQKNGTVALGDP